MKKTLLTAIVFVMGLQLSAQTLEPGVSGTLTDLTPDGVNIKNELPQKGDEGKKLIVLGDKLFFIGEDATHGQELWVTDGTTENTSLLKDIEEGTGSSNPTNLEISGDKLYFVATTAAAGAELWVTDGTPEGTTMVQDLYTGANGSNPASVTAFKGGVLFRATDLVSEAFEQAWLYWSDGAGITSVAQIQPRKEGDSKLKFIQVTHNGEKAFFVGEDEVYGNELWVTDGTEEGTHMVLDIGFAPDDANVNEGATVSTKIEWHYAVNDEQVIFRAETPAWWIGQEDSYESIGEELWVSDGTAQGTYCLGDFNQSVGDDVTKTNGTQFAYPFLYLNQVFFRADDGVHNVELCKTADLAPGSVENVLNTNGPNPDDGSEWPTWVESSQVWDSLFYFFINNGSATEQWPEITGHEVAVYDGMKDTVYCLWDAWGESDGLQHSWGKPEPRGVNKRLYLIGKSDQGSTDKAVYYVLDRNTDPTHTPVKLFNGTGDASGYIIMNFNENLIIVSQNGDEAKLYMYDDGEAKEPVTAHGISGPNVYQSPGNRTGVKNITVSSVNIFPNPASDFITVQMNQDKAYTLIVNNAGQVIWKGEVFNQKSIDISNLNSGSYIMMIQTNSGVVPSRLVIAK